ncbi:hypothetical protein D3C84_704960 [compost metagenome]
MKPKAMPLAIEKVSGMARAATTTGAATVRSSQSICARLLIISTATNSSAGAVAKAGTAPARGAKNRLRRNSRATTQAVRPVRPPAAMPAADSM